MPRSPESVTLRQAVLLVGGRGTRMWPLTADRPKGLIPVAGVPFLDLQIRQLTSAGIQEVFLAVGRDQLAEWEAFAGVRDGVRLIVEDEPLDTAGPVRAALDQLDERFMVLNGDVIVETDLAGFVESVPPDAEATLGLVEVEDTSAYGVVVVDDGAVRSFVEKPPPELAPARTVNAGMYVLQRSALSDYPEAPLSFERVVFPDLVERESLGAVVLTGDWLDIGTPPLYLACTGAVLQGATRLHEATAPHLIDGDVAGTVDGDWAWVEAGASVAAGAVVSESVVLEGAHIGPDARIDGAIVGWGARVGAGAVVTGASIVGPGAVIGDGCEIDQGMRVAPRAELAPGSVTFSPPD